MEITKGPRAASPAQSTTNIHAAQTAQPKLKPPRQSRGVRYEICGAHRVAASTQATRVQQKIQFAPTPTHASQTRTIRENGGNANRAGRMAPVIPSEDRLGKRFFFVGM